MTTPAPGRPAPPLSARALRVFAEFFRFEAAGGIVLICAAALALVCANSPLAAVYEASRAFPLGIGAGAWSITKPAELWINDGLMAVFFLLVALEIKRET